MKKLCFVVMPLMAITLLASCGGDNPGPGPSPEPEEEVKFSATSTVTLDETKTKANISLDWTPTNHSIECTGFTFTLTNQSDIKSTIVPGEPGSRPLNLAITFDKALSKDDTGDLKFHYNDKTAKKEGDGEIKGINVKRALEDCTWKEINEISKSGKAKETFKIGDTKTVEVNNKNHTVRIIGFNQDKDKDNNDIGITFEFVNAISDSDGYSIATQWNDTNNTSSANHNYLDSSIRKALTNEGKGHILWARKGAEAWVTEDDYKKSILEMLPSDLVDALVAPKKTVQCYVDKKWTTKPITNNDGKYDKLFLLSPEEMGNTREGAYSYYQESDIEKLQHSRIKKQINGADILEKSSQIPSGSGQTYQDIVYNYAGYNMSDDYRGGFSWLRSPYLIDDASRAYFIGVSGGILTAAKSVYNRACAIAPAFCI